MHTSVYICLQFGPNHTALVPTFSIKPISIGTLFSLSLSLSLSLFFIFYFLFLFLLFFFIIKSLAFGTKPPKQNISRRWYLK